MNKKWLVLIGLATLAHSSSAQNFSAEEIKQRAIERRAVEAVIWGIMTMD